MSNASDFVIAQGELLIYSGSGGDVVIPEGVTHIRAGAFYGRKNLTSLTIPNSVKRIDDRAFCGCKGLADENGFIIVRGVLHGYEGTSGEVDIPDGVTSIGGDAFSGCENITNVVIPDSVTSIGDGAFRGCKGLADENGFIVVRGVLHGYEGTSGEVAIPNGVTSIGGDAFSGCENIISVVISNSVTSIGEGAFSRCENLTSVTIPESVTSIGDSAFCGCKGLADENGFVVVRGILYSYYGPGGDVVIPDGVTSIGKNAFGWCGKLTSVTLPDGVTSIGEGAFSRCENLTSVVIPNSMISIGEKAFSCCMKLMNVVIPESVKTIGEYAFLGCGNLTSIVLCKDVSSVGNNAFNQCGKLQTVRMPKCVFDSWYDVVGGGSANMGAAVMDAGTVKFYAFSKNNTTSNRISYIEPGDWAGYDRNLVNNGPSFKYSLPARLFGALGRLADPVDLDENWRAEYLALLLKNAKKLIELAAELQCPEIVQQMFVVGVINEGNQKALRPLIAASPVAEIVALSDTQAVSAAAPETVAPPAVQVPSAIDCSELLAAKKEIEKKFKAFYGVALKELPGVCDVNGEPVDPVVFAHLLTLHEKQKQVLDKHTYDYKTDVVAEYEEPGLCPEAQALVEKLDNTSLQQALRTLADTNLGLVGRSKRMFLAYPICRYADDALMEELTKRAPSWRSAVSKNDAPPLATFRKANLYSNSRAAMLLADKYGELKKYAKLRGTDADTIRNLHLSDIGIDEAGGKVYDLGSQTVTVRLQKDLSFLVELPDGKTAKSLPKKGADEAEYAAADADFAQMKKDAKQIVKQRRTVLFEQFLDGKGQEAQVWMDGYLHNPLLRSVASLVVWQQGKKTFTLGEAGLITADGSEYAVGSGPIKVAHPIEMKPNDITAWQKYFTDNNLKQPFAQIWEPVVDPVTIRPDRYEGQQISVFRTMHMERHGITFHDEDFHNEIWFDTEACSLEHERTIYHRHEIAKDETFTLGKFEFEKYSRRVNHIVSLFDKWTIMGRIVDDDVNVVNLIDGATVAQVAEYIALAAKHKCANVSAALMAYKNTHFTDFNPMDEFVLDEL